MGEERLMPAAAAREAKPAAAPAPAARTPSPPAAVAQRAATPARRPLMVEAGPPALRLVPQGGGPGQGQALDEAVRERLEGSLGVDLGGVRVHTDPGARRAAEQLGARAFAHGPDIFLGPGERASDISLLAHE